MAQLVVSDEGEQWLLDTLLKTPLETPQEWRVHIYTNDYTPLADVTLDDLDELDLPGYTPQPIDRSMWPDSASVGGQAQSVYGGNPVQFEVDSGSATYFGFYVTTEDDLTLLWVQRNDASAVVDPLHPAQAVLKFAGRSQSEPT